MIHIRCETSRDSRRFRSGARGQRVLLAASRRAAAPRFLRGVVWAVCCMVLYSCMLIQRCMALYGAVWRCMAVWRRGEGVTMRDTCMEQYSCMVSCMVFLLYSTKWRTETHADSVPVGEDGVTEGVGRYPAPMAACTAAWAHPGHAPLPRHTRQGCMAGCMEFGCISLLSLIHI